jgi:CheY-like chemotaxis protein
MSANPQGPILVVEDVSNIRELLDVTLTFKGYPVRTAADGEEALRIIAEERPALVISDILMPNLDGFGLIQRIRIDPKTRDIPIIMISATYVSEQDREFALKLGAVRFLEKPVDTDEFLLTVAEIMTQGPRGSRNRSPIGSSTSATPSAWNGSSSRRKPRSSGRSGCSAACRPTRSRLSREF